MSKTFLFMMTTVDGYFEGENQDISWHNAGNKEFEEFAIENLANTDTLVFGRRTYNLMASFWPSEQAIQEDPRTAKIMNEYKKVVFTNTQIDDMWQNVEVSDDVVGKMTELKQRPGKDVAVLGSSNLCVSLMREGLLDELRIMVNPTVIGKGTMLFEGIDKKYDFDLVDTRTFESDNVLLTYTVKK